MESEMQHHYEGSACGRFVYGVITDENGEEIDRYLSEDSMEIMYGGDY